VPNLGAGLENPGIRIESYLLLQKKYNIYLAIFNWLLRTSFAYYYLDKGANYCINLAILGYFFFKS